MGAIVGIAGALAVAAAPAATNLGAWQVTDNVSALDGSHDFHADLISDSTVTNIIDRDDHPILGLSCTHQGLFLTFVWPDFIDKDYDQSSVDLTWKVDDGPVQHSSWSAVSQGLVAMGPNGLAWARKWSTAKTLVVRVPDKHGGQEATFQLTGLDQVVTQVSQMNCG
jgi:hypothetical protein